MNAATLLCCCCMNLAKQRSSGRTKSLGSPTLQTRQTLQAAAYQSAVAVQSLSISAWRGQTAVTAARDASIRHMHALLHTFNNAYRTTDACRQSHTSTGCCVTSCVAQQQTTDVGHHYYSSSSMLLLAPTTRISAFME
jgi:hypothetical protein